MLVLASIGLCCRLDPVVLIVDGSIPCAAGAIVGAYILLRSFRLSAIAGLLSAAAVALAQGLLIVLGWSLSPARFGAIYDFSGPGGDVNLAIFTEGLVAAGLVLWQLRIAVAKVSAGATPHAAARTSRDRSLGVGIASLLSVMAPTLLPLYREVRERDFFTGSSIEASAIAAVVGAAVAMWFCFVVLPLVVAESRFPEEAIVRFNRAQERLQRALTPLEVLMEPRWALSATGIAAIVFALIFLDRVRISDGRTTFAVLEIWNSHAVTFYGTALAIFAIGIVWTRSWRAALSCTIAAVSSATIAAWLALRTGFVPSLDAVSFDYSGFRAWEMVATGSAVIAGLVFLVGSAAAARAPDGKAAQQALATRLSESASAVVCIVLAALLASILSLSPAGVILAIAGAAAALVLMPCCYVALNTLLPRYRSVEEVFGRK
jgi:hypothetical protein